MAGRGAVASTADGRHERAEAQEFWFDFFDIFGVRRPRVASFEHAVRTHGGSRGKDLVRARTRPWNDSPA